MNTLAKINVAKMDVAKEINEKIYDLYDENDTIEDFMIRITDYIEKEHLFIS